MRKAKPYFNSVKVAIVCASGTLVSYNNILKKQSFGNGHLLRSCLFAENLDKLWSNEGEKVSEIFKLAALGEKPEALLVEKLLKVKPCLVWCDLREAVSSNFINTLQSHGIAVCLYDCNSSVLKKIAYYCVEALPLATGKKEENTNFKSNLLNLSGLQYLLLRTSKRKRIKPNFVSKNKRQSKKKILVYIGGITQTKYWKEVVEALTSCSRDEFWKKKNSKIPSKSNSRNHSFPQSVPLHITLIVSENINLENRAKLLNFVSSHTNRSCSFKLKLLANFDENNTKLQAKAATELFKNFASSHLFITYFGITFFQSLEMALPTILVSPTSIHKKLAMGNFPQLTMHEETTYEKVNALVKDININNPIGKAGEKLCAIVATLAKNFRRVSIYCRCELCGAISKVFARSQEHNWIYCSNCKSFCRDNLSLQNFFPLDLPSYGKEYFLQEYEKQYGKTYEQDEAGLKKLARERSRAIMRLLPKSKEVRSVLDVGAAYGYFLDVMQQLNFMTYGIEYSLHAQKIAAEKHAVLKADVLKMSKRSLLKKFKIASFNVVTLWYVIEHFDDISTLVEKIALWQPVGGVLGISTPNARGISSRFSIKNFLEASPSDHYYVYSAKGLKLKLAKYGYRLMHIHSRGIHKYRYKKLLPFTSTWLPFKFFVFVAQWLNFGDTIDLFLVKTNE